ncbi:amino acid ABC transporter membrane protein, PAAT family (TC 3.A.1.3.-) [Clostridium cavendishii DSM 21758]|uniref:Amino acid ABC transporter membrane protein, PAAT family (TC 3.A.1.3.-) n=1 Tax=Clostridium cavendishii DSM 21758 TaxID=1121302 RepID=A0A1M6FBE2_9CLOT|nr:amino acid ABC transporter permease [Clostridium cavendishii]SHI94993.1 amino acid ABC transporter membrane protein, PAAT family (TC 3.A.1.3.-) [Clostridium cavendishii DSM 21758]
MKQILNFEFMIGAFGKILEALPTTILLTVVSMFFAVIIAFLVAIIRIYKVSVLKNITAIYVSFTRGTPLLVQIYLAYYGIPKFLDYINKSHGLSMDISNIPPIIFAFVSFSLNVGAYLSETFRASIEAVDKGQMEAALSVGMTRIQAFKRIIMAQALEMALPNIGNTLISLVKDTSLAFSISIVDLMSQAKLVGAEGLNFFEVYIVVAIIYWIICIFIEKAFVLLEIRFKRYKGGVVV